MRAQYLPVVAKEAASEFLWTEVGQVGGAILCRAKLHGLQPITGQYSDHVISVDQSGAGAGVRPSLDSRLQPLTAESRHCSTPALI